MWYFYFILLFIFLYNIYIYIYKIPRFLSRLQGICTNLQSCLAFGIQFRVLMLVSFLPGQQKQQQQNTKQTKEWEKRRKKERQKLASALNKKIKTLIIINCPFFLCLSLSLCFHFSLPFVRILWQLSSRPFFFQDGTAFKSPFMWFKA